MGRTYLFNCPRCIYTAKVSGGPDQGFNYYTQTIACRECKELYDANTRARIAEAEIPQRPRLWRAGALMRPETRGDSPRPGIAGAKLLFAGRSKSKWVSLKLRCPVSARHQIQPWSAPGKCPRCGTYLERTLMPYRIWD